MARPPIRSNATPTDTKGITMNSIFDWTIAIVYGAALGAAIFYAL